MDDLFTDVHTLTDEEISQLIIDALTKEIDEELACENDAE